MHLEFCRNTKISDESIVRMQFFSPKCRKKEICRVIDPEESIWKSNLPPLFSVEMFADSVVGLRAKLAKSKEVTELTCLNLFCASSCLAALAAGWQPARGHLAGCALGCRETLRKNSWTRGGGKRSPTPRTAKPQSADDLIFAQIRDSRLESGFVKSIWMSELGWFWSLVFDGLYGWFIC